MRCLHLHIGSRVALAIVHLVVSFATHVVMAPNNECIQLMNVFGGNLIAIVPTLFTICEFVEKTGNCDPIMHILVLCVHLILTTITWTLAFQLQSQNVCIPTLFQQSFLVSLVMSLSILMPFFHLCLSGQAMSVFVKLDWKQNNDGLLE